MCLLIGKRAGGRQSRSSAASAGYKRYVDTLLQESGVDGTATTPAKDELFERVGEDGGQVDPPTREWFHSLVARLLYLAKILRRQSLTAAALSLQTI